MTLNFSTIVTSNSLQEQIRSYYDNPALSQSMGKALMSGIGTYRKQEREGFREDPDHFILGSAVDVRLCTPQLFEELHYVSQLQKKPSDKMRSILRRAFYLFPSIDKTDMEMINPHNLGVILECANHYEYYMNRQKELSEELELLNINKGRLTSIRKEGLAYWRELIQSGNRVILSSEEIDTVDRIVQSFKTHHTVGFYFNKGWIDLFQVPIYWEYKGIQCKGLIDQIRINTTKKLIQLIDIKTIGGSAKTFPTASKRRRYDLQGAWYQFGFSHVKTLVLNLNAIDLSEYKILPFKFIVESTKFPGICPLVYTMTSVDSYIARYGCTKHISSLFSPDKPDPFIVRSKIWGFEEMVDNYLWHLKNGFELDREIVEEKHHLNLNTWTS